MVVVVLCTEATRFVKLVGEVVPAVIISIDVAVVAATADGVEGVVGTSTGAVNEGVVEEVVEEDWLENAAGVTSGGLGVVGN